MADIKAQLKGETNNTELTDYLNSALTEALGVEVDITESLQAPNEEAVAEEEAAQRRRVLQLEMADDEELALDDDSDSDSSYFFKEPEPDAYYIPEDQKNVYEDADSEAEVNEEEEMYSVEAYKSSSRQLQTFGPRG